MSPPPPPQKKKEERKINMYFKIGQSTRPWQWDVRFLQLIQRCYFLIPSYVSHPPPLLVLSYFILAHARHAVPTSQMRIIWQNKRGAMPRIDTPPKRFRNADQVPHGGTRRTPTAMDELPPLSCVTNKHHITRVV